MNRTQIPYCLHPKGVRSAALAFVFGFCTLASIDAQLFIDVGNNELLPNTPGQTVSIYLRNEGSPGVEVGGLDFAVEIADGGPQAGGQITGPSITAVDLTTGTIFDGNNNGNGGDKDNSPQLQFWSTFRSHVPSPTLASGNNKIATLTFDTTGLSPSSWSFRLFQTDIGDTFVNDSDGNPMDVTINNGTVFVPVPEVQAAPIVAGLLGVFAVFRKIRNRSVSIA
jgi:hypothetical protein